MTILQAAPTRTDDRRTSAPGAGLRRRSTPHMLLGAVLVVVCALAFVVTGLRLDPRTAVLALARAVSAGHVLTDSDLTVMQIVPDPALGALPESQRSAVVGHSVRLPLAAHSLLSQDVLGPTGWPPPGQSLIAVSVKPGHAPVGLTAGAQVLVLIVPTPTTTAGGSTNSAVPQASAAVYEVGTPDSSGTTVVSLLVTNDDAKRIASASGDAALVVQGGAG